MRSLHQQLELGNVTEEEAATRNREYLTALQTANPQFHLFQPASTSLAPTSFPSAVPLPISSPAVPHPPSRIDLFGSGRWPPTATPRGPMDLFSHDTKISGFDVDPGWYNLPEDQKEAYRARSETPRRAAWAEHETALAAGTSRFTPSGLGEGEGAQRQPRPGNLVGLASGGEGYPTSGSERFPGIPRMPGVITGFKIFHDELGAATEFQEVDRRWHALTEGRKEAYKARATAAATRAAYHQGRSLG